MNAFTGLILQQVWFRVMLWIVGIGGITVIVPFAFEGLYSSASEREALMQTLDNPAMIAMIGPVPQGAYTIAVMFSHQMLVFMAVIHGLFGITIANNLSRSMEDEGLIEYINSAGVTRQSIFLVQMLVGVGMNVLLGLIILVGTYLSPSDSFTLLGCTIYAIGTSMFSLMFYTLTLIFAQLFQSAEWTFGTALSILLMLYLYRAITDVVQPGLSFLSPYSWLTRLEPFASNEATWLLPFMLIIIFTWFAWRVFARRDLGDAYFASNTNRKSRSIGSYPRLMTSSTKMLVLSWLTGMTLIGLSYGSIFGDLDVFISENAFLADSLADSGGNPIDQFISVLIMVTAIIGVIPALMITGRILREEKHGRLEWLISAGIGRTSMLISHGLYATVIGAIGILLALFGMYSASVTVADINMSARDYIFAALNYSAGVAVFVGLSMLLIGWRARMHFIVWFYLLATFFINYLGLILGLDDRWLLVTPFYYLSALPAEEMAWTPWGIILFIAIALAGIGMILFRRRDTA